MIAIPAVDIRDGCCVQLVGGAFADERIRLPDPVAAARRWIDAGFTRLHVVDLNAAMGTGSNAESVRSLLQLDDVQAIGAGGTFVVVDGASGRERYRGLLAGEPDHDRVSKMPVRARGGRRHELPYFRGDPGNG